jgi:hypothetical protein
MKKIISIVLILSCYVSLFAQQPDASELMSKSRDLTMTGSMSAKLRLLITEKNGSSRTRTIAMATKSYNDETEKRLIEFLSPADVKNTRMLIVDNKNSDDEMWIYLPALKKTRRIVSSEKGRSFMSSEFSNADMSSPTISDFINRHLEGSGKNNTWIIESKPKNEDKADEYGYERKVSYITMDSLHVRKMEFYNFDNELFKIIEITKIHPLRGEKFIISEMTADNLLNGRKSEIDMTDITVGDKMDDSVFTIRNLER